MTRDAFLAVALTTYGITMWPYELAGVTLYCARRLGTVPDQARTIANWVWWLTRWPALGSIVLLWAAQAVNGAEPISNTIGALFLFGTWWLFHRDGDDDTRRRLREKLHAKVSQVASRLVVVPATA